MILPRLPKGFSSPVKIGSGGFGEVYRVRQDALDRFVALKFFLGQDSHSRSVLKQEATMQAGLHIRGIPQIYDVLEFSGQLCIVMQWINGCNLRFLLQTDLSFDSRMDLAKEIIEICASFHQQGYAHRDIKPENFLVSSEGVFLIDFGLAHRIEAARQTSANVVKGTLAYIAPEILKGNNLSADEKRADLFSIGKVVQELFDGAPLPECVRRCLSENPSDRPESAVKLAEMSRPHFIERPVRWEKIAEPLASEQLARQLLSTAQALVRKNKPQQAYPLLVECLQVFPELPGAFELMENFPRFEKRKKTTMGRKSMALGGGIAFSLIAVTLILFGLMGEERQKKNSFSVTSPNSRLILVSEKRESAEKKIPRLPFKENSFSSEFLCGFLKISGHPTEGSLTIDGKEVDSNSGQFSFPFPAEDRLIVWKNSGGETVWKEVVQVLPFQTKRLEIKERR